MAGALKVFTGNANPGLARSIADSLGLEIGLADVKTFSDGEVRAELGENVRGSDTYVVQPTCAHANTNLMELLILLDTARRASADRITAVIPYLGYARQDRKDRPRVPITAKLVADLITTAGAQRVLTVDLHAGQIQGFFNVPVDHLFAMPVLLEELRRTVTRDEPITVVSPDVGGVERARAFAKRMDAPIAIADKRRQEANQVEVLRIVGEVQDRTAVIVDDIVDTAGSLTQTARALKQAGALRVLATVTHPVLSGPALKRIEESEIERLIVTDTIPGRSEIEEHPKIVTISIAAILGEAIRRIHNAESVSSLFV